MNEREFFGRAIPDGKDVSKNEEQKRVFEIEQALKLVSAIADDGLHRYSELTEEERTEKLRVLNESEEMLAEALKYPLTTPEVVHILWKLAHTYDSEEAGKGVRFRNEFVFYTLDKIEKFAPIFEERLEQENNGLKVEDVVHLYEELLDQNKGDFVSRERGAALLARHLEWLNDRMLEEDYHVQNYLLIITAVIEYGPHESSRAALEYLVYFAATARDWSNKLYVVNFLLNSERTDLQEQASEIVGHMLEEAGLPAEKMWNAWSVSCPPKGLRWRVRHNLRDIAILEKETPGICKFLYEEYGIADFARYPTDLLKEQYEQRDNKELPYGVVIYPRNDHNGAFYGDNPKFERLQEQLKGEFLLRVMECESKQDIARALLKLNEKYHSKGEGQKISLLILGGHGTERTVQFGGTDERHVLNIADLVGRGVQKTRQFFEENPTVILASCSTGSEGGIAQEISRVFNADVIAPKVPTNVKGYYAKKKGDKFQFTAQYTDTDSRRKYSERSKQKAT